MVDLFKRREREIKRDFEKEKQPILRSEAMLRNAPFSHKAEVKEPLTSAGTPNTTGKEKGTPADRM